MHTSFFLTVYIANQRSASNPPDQGYIPFDDASWSTSNSISYKELGPLDEPSVYQALIHAKEDTP